MAIIRQSVFILGYGSEGASQRRTSVALEKGGPSNTQLRKKKNEKKGRRSTLLFGSEDNQTMSVEPSASVAGESYILIYHFFKCPRD